MFEAVSPTPLQRIHDPFLDDKGITLYIKRDDTIHPKISGNKWRKLKYNLIQAKEEGHTTILTFGGAYSNHIAATAAAAKAYGFRAIGVIRGDELDENANPTLAGAAADGMQLEFVSREVYRKKYQPEYSTALADKFGPFYQLPEGGSNPLALAGCKEIVDEIDRPFDVIVTAVGTGGTLAGLVSGLPPASSALGISVLKGAAYLDQEVSALLGSLPQKPGATWKINHDYHVGGYARFTDPLVSFINDFKARHQVPLDPVYTGKMMMALFDMIEKKVFKPGTTLVALHTGGLQGIAGFNQRNSQQIT